MELLLRVNGVQPAFGFEFGSDSPRAAEGRAGDPYRQANTSYSLVQRQGAEIVRHTLIDVGMGVVPSLVDFEHTHGVRTVDEVLLTHPHFDHFAQLDWLSMSLVRSERAEQPRPLPIYATAECWDNGPSRVLRYVAERSDFRPLRSGASLTLGELVLTPFAVDHGPKAPGAMGFVIEHGGRKVIITGDFLHVVHEDDPLLVDADVVFFDANTWHPAEWTSHQSVLGNLRLVEKWRPRRSYMIHYSGYEDRRHPQDRVNGPMDREHFRQELGRISAGRDLQLAAHGMILALAKVPGTVSGRSNNGS